MRTEIDLNESEIDLNECEHFLKVNLDRSEIHASWIHLSVNGLNISHNSTSDYGGYGVAFFATGHCWILKVKMYIFLTLDFTLL